MVRFSRAFADFGPKQDPVKLNVNFNIFFGKNLRDKNFDSKKIVWSIRIF